MSTVLVYHTGWLPTTSGMERSMPYLKVGEEDGRSIDLYYKDWGSGQPVIFCHGWPLSADAWESQLLFFASNGYRGIAHDRRGHGRSTQASGGHDMDTYAEDLSKLIEALDLKDMIMVGHSTGGGELTRYIGRDGTGCVAGIVLVSAIPPLLLKTAANPAGLPMEVLDALRGGMVANRAQFFRDFSEPFYGREPSRCKGRTGHEGCLLAPGHARRP
jgi:non-heme chloroperoxidase